MTTDRQFRTEAIPVAEPATTSAASYVESAATLTDQDLLGISLFDAVDIATVRPLLHRCPVRTLAPDEVLLSSGRPNHDVYLVLSGRLSVRLASADAAPIAEIAAGESVGELSMIDRQPTSAFVVAQTETRVLAVEEQLMWMLVNTSHAISTNLLYTLTKRLRYGNRIIFESRERLEHYRFHATVDALSGLFNRHWLNTMLPRQMHRSRMRNEPLSLLMIDIDRFKQFNDEYGHVVGDHAIREVAASLGKTVRPGDMAVRYGGEEFLVLLPDCSQHDGMMVGERIRSAVTKVPITAGPESEGVSVTVSVGVAEQGEHGSLESFVAAADAALFRAKRGGRNRVES